VFSNVGEDGAAQVVAYNATNGATLWSRHVGNSFVSSPTVVNGVLSVGAGVELDRSSKGKLYALNAITGTVLWSATFPPEGNSSKIRTAPLVVNGLVYVATEYGRLAAFKASGCGSQTCAPLWETARLGYVESTLAYDNGALYLGSGSDAVIAINAQTGATLWTVPTGGFVFASPAVANGVVYIGGGDKKLYAFDEKTGATLWTDTFTQDVGTPAIANGVLYVTGDNLYVLNAQTGKLLWTAKGNTNQEPF